MPGSRTSGREQTVRAMNVLQRNHKTDEVQITGECTWRNAGWITVQWIYVNKVLTCLLRSSDNR